MSATDKHDRDELRANEIKDLASQECVIESGLENFDLETALYGSPKERDHDSLVRHFKLKVTKLGKNEVEAQIVIDYVHCRPSPLGFILNGGTSLVLAESLAGLASMVRCGENEQPVGINVSANHTAIARLGERIIATATVVNAGRTVHVWNVDIRNAKGTLISSARVTNSIINRRT